MDYAKPFSKRRETIASETPLKLRTHAEPRTNPVPRTPVEAFPPVELQNIP